MLVFPHIPKTAGSSFGNALKSVYKGELILDYTTVKRKNMSRLTTRLEGLSRRLLKPRAKVVYGHFWLYKYRGLATHRGAFFRNPIERAMSHYFYTERTAIDPLEFVKWPMISGVYANYLSGFPVEKLSFVGITEEYELSCRLFGKIFGRELMVRHDRTGDGIDYRAWLRDRSMLDAVIESQANNQHIYDQARRRFDTLCRTYLV